MNATTVETENPFTLAASGELVQIPLERIVESPHNPRKHFDHAALEDLAASLRSIGQLTPVIVRPSGDLYELAAGHRRYRAAKLAGLGHLLAVVKQLDDTQFLEILTIENLQRDDLHPLEEAHGFAELIKHAGYDVDRIASRIGKSTRYVYDLLKVHHELIPEAKKLFLEDMFSLGHAIIMSRLTVEHQRKAIGEHLDEGYPDGGGLFEHQGGHDSENEELPLNDKVKAVSVREFQEWVDNHCRATPETIDAFDFPETARAIQQATEEDEKVVHITRDYRLDDDAKDPHKRTFGLQSWKRADGEADPSDEMRYLYGVGNKKKSKPATCAFSVLGVVVAGQGRGEAFRVCVNKDKCDVHWKSEREERAKRAKASGSRARADDSYEKQMERQRQEAEKREARQKRLDKALPKILEALAERIKKAPAHATSAIADIVIGKARQSKNCLVPRGKTAEDALRHAAYLELEGVNTYWPDEGLKAIAAFGVNWKKILDEVVPEPKAEKPADVSKTEKKPKGRKGAK